MRRLLFALASLLALSACSDPAQPARTASFAPVAPSTASANRSTPIVKQLAIPSDSCCVLAVDEWLNRIYVSRTADPAGSNTTVVNGTSFTAVTTISGSGGAHNTDSKTHDFWLPGLYYSNVNVYSGRTDSQIATVDLGACPTDSWIDAKRRRAWISAQCGSGDDPVWAVNADTYQDLSGWIGTGGVMGVTVLDRITGNFYVNNSSGNYVVDRNSFQIQPTSFGVAYAANSSRDLVYAAISNGLNVVDGSTEKIVRTIPLKYSPTAIAVNGRLNRVYLASGSNVIDVRDATTGAAIKTMTLPSGIAVVTLAAHGSLGRIYAAVQSGGNDYLYLLRDTDSPDGRATSNGANVSR